MSESVRSYYAGLGEREWARLTTPSGAIEFAVNTHALEDHLPPGARVLDIGGGPARYALWLAERGHRVTLADLSPELLAIARREVAQSPYGAQVEEIVKADARDLSRWGDGSFDATLSLGPFYHLPDAEDRERAAGELARVLCPGGLAFVASMTRYSFLRRTAAIRDERHHLTQPAFVARLMEDGVFINDVPGRFTDGYGAHPQEIAPFFERHGFETVELLASEGIAWGIQDALAEMSADEAQAYQVMLELVLRTANDPSILGASDHLLYVGRKVDQASRGRSRLAAAREAR
ncbi:MAG: class I SAM-dependent methyltransferase [Anaerolineae bacterium]|jgi:SAM-dependent methyltransferase